MIHTGKFRAPATVAKLFSEKFAFNKRIDLHLPNGITISYHNNFFNQQVLFIFVDFIQLLGKKNITENDADLTEDLLTSILKNYFIPYESIWLTRIDYRFDTIVSDKHREILFKLYRKKGYKKFGHKKINTKYNTALYYNTKSTKILIYDKELERKNKYPIEALEYKSVLRFEFGLMSPHLSYRKRKYETEKNLNEYFTHEYFIKYFTEVIRIMGTGDYYKLPIAEKIIRSSDIPTNYKKTIREFLVSISMGSITTTKEKKINGELVYKESKYRKILRYLNEIDINHILIPKNWDCDSIIENPLKQIKKFFY